MVRLAVADALGVANGMAMAVLGSQGGTPLPKDLRPASSTYG